MARDFGSFCKQVVSKCGPHCVSKEDDVSYRHTLSLEMMTIVRRRNDNARR